MSFTAFDILYYKDKQITDLPLMERKKLLEKVLTENESIAISRYIEEQGISFYQLEEANELGLQFVMQPYSQIPTHVISVRQTRGLP